MQSFLIQTTKTYAHAQADLSFRWVHMSEGMFFHTEGHFIQCSFGIKLITCKNESGKIAETIMLRSVGKRPLRHMPSVKVQTSVRIRAV